MIPLGAPTLAPLACGLDPHCKQIMGALGPVLPPASALAIDVPGTCQYQTREWLRTNKEINFFTVERVRQRYGMGVFYCVLDGPNWLRNDLWMTDIHECDWYNKLGFDPCNRYEEVEVIRLHANNLVGTLTPDLAVVTSLCKSMGTVLGVIYESCG
jgi:hypothetical protein